MSSLYTDKFVISTKQNNLLSFSVFCPRIRKKRLWFSFSITQITSAFSLTGDEVYLGMTRVDLTTHPRDFNWLDGTPVENTYNNFPPGEPDNNSGNDGCVVFNTNDGLWRTEQCSPLRHYVCQRDAGEIFCSCLLKFCILHYRVIYLE